MNNILFTARVVHEGKLQGGPVTTADWVFFEFVNRFDDLDMYFQLRKNEDGRWYKTAGPSTIDYPYEVIQDVGRQIDEYIQTNQV